MRNVRLANVPEITEQAMENDNLKRRTKQFALRVIKLVEDPDLPGEAGDAVVVCCEELLLGEHAAALISPTQPDLAEASRTQFANVRVECHDPYPRISMTPIAAI